MPHASELDSGRTDGDVWKLVKLGLGEVFSCFSSSLCVYRASGHSIMSKIAILLLMPIESFPYILSDLYAECISQMTP